MKPDDDLARRVRTYALGLDEATRPVSIDQIATRRERGSRPRLRIIPVAIAALTVVAVLVVAVTVARSRTVRHAQVAVPGTVQMAAAPLAGRSTFSSVWTGQEFLVWGGADIHNHPFDDGAAYNPRTNRWRRISKSPLGARQGAATVWTGQSMFVWGGFDPQHDRWYTDGALYNPTSDRWTKIAGAPIRGRELPATVWTGHEVIVLGGFWGPALADGATFDPSTDEWHRLPPAPIAIDSSPTPNVAWTGLELIVASVAPANSTETSNGNIVFIAAYVPRTNTWQRLPSIAQHYTPAVFWTRDELLLMSPLAGTQSVALIGGEQRQQLANPAAPINEQIGAAWTGKEALFVGPDHSLAYDPIINTWRKLPPIEISQRNGGAVIWADGELIVWGGLSRLPPQQTLSDGVLYRPPV